MFSFILPGVTSEGDLRGWADYPETPEGSTILLMSPKWFSE
jgi:hypothetical protein